MCITDTIQEVRLGQGKKMRRAALLSVDFTSNPAALQALRRLPEPSLAGTVRWSWLHNLASDDVEGTLWRFDVTTAGKKTITFAVAGGLTPEIRTLLSTVERILITADPPTNPLAVLDTVLAEVPADGFNDTLN